MDGRVSGLIEGIGKVGGWRDWMGGRMDGGLDGLWMRDVWAGGWKDG